MRHNDAVSLLRGDFGNGGKSYRVVIFRVCFVEGFRLEPIEIVLQLLFLLLCLSAMGEPWRLALRKFFGLFNGVNLLQILVLDVYLGCFLLYVIAIVPLHLFSATMLYGVTLASSAATFLFHRGRIKSFIKNLTSPKKLSFRNHGSLELVIVGVLFLFGLVVQTFPLSTLIFGSVRDTAIHSLFTQVVIENRQIPMTLQPYLDEGIVYPQGFSVIAAYSVFILNYLPPQAVFYLTSLFNALTILGAYFLGKTLELSRNWRIGLSLAFVFAFVATWPKYITWGSNPFVVSFPFYFVCLSLLPLIMKEKLRVRTILAIGVLFGYLSVLHLQPYQTLVVSAFVVWFYIALKEPKGRLVRLGRILAISGVSLMVLSPFLYREVAFFPYPYHNVGIPTDVEIPTPQPNFNIVFTGAVWLFENIGPNVTLQLASVALFAVAIIMMAVFRRRTSFTQSHELVKLGIATLVGEFLIFLFVAISPGDMPFYPQLLMLYVPLYLFVAALNFPLYRFFSSLLSKRIFPKASQVESGARHFLVIAISLMLIIGVYSPFLCQSIVFDAAELYGSYSVFGVTTAQDLQLILWMKDNLPRNASVLINNFQAGAFIPSVANYRVVFPSFGSSYSVSYQELVGLLQDNVFNATALMLMKRFNITNIYVGAGVSSYESARHRWDPLLFLGNPNFDMVKNFGNAYLFQCDYADASLIFSDDFERGNWEKYGWQTQYYDNGLGNVTITSGFGHNSQRSLRISAQAMYTVSEWEYGRSVSRVIFVPNSTDVTFSFYLRAIEGFNGKDTFAVVISNIYRNQTMIVTTPGGVYEGYANAKTLGGFEGAFRDNLSESWRQLFHSSLPNILLFELVNWDLDGIRNVAYVDDVVVTATPVP